MGRRKWLTLATFNVNGIGTRLGQLLAWLEREQPDVVALQELKATDAAFPADALEAAGYGALWHGQRSWNGVALLGRGVVPQESRRGLPGEPADRQSRYLEAAVHGILVGALYLPNGNPQPGPKFDYKLRWMRRLARHAAGLVDLPHPVVLMGDFNVIPTDGDVYDAKAWRKDALIQPEVRAAYEDLLAQGWTDALHAHCGDAAPYTFWDYFRQHAERDRGLRIDHLLLNRALAPRLVEAGVDRWVRLQEKASDHAPTWIRIAAATPAKRARKQARAAATPDKPGAPARTARRRASA